MRRWLSISAAACAVTAFAFAVPPDAGTKSTAPPAEAGDAAKRATVPTGLKVDLWAAEPSLSNPVAFTFDEQGKCYVVETNRFGDGVPDTRSFMHWLDDDIGARSVEDRLAMYKKHDYKGFEKFGDQVRLVWDSTGSGKADRSTVFAGPYNTLADGLAAGVLARKGDVFLTSIPSLYRLRDTKNVGKADQSEVMSTGYGIHVQFVGHDLHGLTMGPDGKLYFSIGDRGFKVTTKEGTTLNNPDSGAVLRCNLDGTKLEIVHVGLRNPQELAFDDHGNLFTYDNNSDSGDKARWVHIVEGGDSGWRCGYQYGTMAHTDKVPQGNRGPWNTEQIWHVPGADSKPPAYVVPALAHFGNGPSGLTYYPGLGLSDRYKGHFFAVDFTANPGNSVIWSLGVKPKGASFEITDLHPFVKNMVATDAEFAPDGAFYWVDWIGGWAKPNKGRIFKVTDPEAMKNPAVAESQKLIAEGFAKKTPAELVALFEHPHRKVRSEAQYELMARGNAAAKALQAYKPRSTIGVLHRLWALQAVGLAGEIVALFDHADPIVRANALKSYRSVPELKNDKNDPLVRIRGKLSDADAQVRAEAARTYGVALHKPATGHINPESQKADFVPLFKLLKDNDNQDAYLRQAVVEALIAAGGGASPCELTSAWKAAGSDFNTPAVRMGVVLALRKMQCSKLDDWLADADPLVMSEAARAIYDQELLRPMVGLAKIVTVSNLPEPVMFRAIAANNKLGGTDHANALAAVAADAKLADHFRLMAMKLLEEWAKPSRRDPITGLAQVLDARPEIEAANAVKANLKKLFQGSNAVRKEAIALTGKLKIAEVGAEMFGLVTDKTATTETRIEALYTLEAVKAPEVVDALLCALDANGPPELSTAARIVYAKADKNKTGATLVALFNDTEVIGSRQMILGTLATLGESPETDKALVAQLDLILAGKFPIELKLDAMEAAQTRSNTDQLKLHAPIREKLKAIDAADRAAVGKDPLARVRESSAGGSAAKGREIFLNNAAVYCLRCHKLDGQGGEVGPAMNGLAKDKDRDYLLESIVNPNAKIAKGYESVIVATIDGKSISGVLRNKTKTELTIVTPENKTITIPVEDVETEKPDKSAMPEDLHKKLSKRELRDVIEFLTTLK